MFITRIITASILFCVLTLFLFVFNKSFNLYLISFLVFVSSLEFSGLLKIKRKNLKILYSFGSLFLFYLTIYMLDYFKIHQNAFSATKETQIFFAISFLVWLCLFYLVIKYPKINLYNPKFFWLNYIFAYFILVPFFTALLFILNSDFGNIQASFVLLLVLCFVFLTDIFAYFGGKLFGKTKLIKNVSPNKTIEGLAIGCFFSLFVLACVSYLLSENLNELYAFFIASFVAIVFGVFGDLVISMYKRYANLKDTGKILPGHGGILDRIDASCGAVVGFYFCYITLT